MPTMIPVLRPFDQSTLEHMREADPVVQRYRARFALFDWSAIDPPRKRGPGYPAHPKSAYLKAALVRIHEHHLTTPRWRAYLLDHPLLVLELGFRPHLDLRQPYGFDVATTVPSVRHLNNILRSLDPRLLADLFAQSVQALQAEIPGLGEVVAYDVKHIYANVKENNFRAYVAERFNKDQQPTGDPDCRLGVKKSTNQEQPDGSTTEKKELLWGYGSGVAAATTPDYGDVVLAEYTLPFNENDVTYFVPVRDADGVPRCPIGLRMHPTYQFQHTNGYRAQRYRCPLLYPAPTGQTCDHEQFRKGKGCVKDINLEAGGLMRVTLDRASPLYQAIYKQRTSCERINSQAKTWALSDPKPATYARCARSIR